jgi:hypothetical protein
MRFFSLNSWLSPSFFIYTAEVKDLYAQLVHLVPIMLAPARFLISAHHGQLLSHAQYDAQHAHDRRVSIVTGNIARPGHATGVPV